MCALFSFRCMAHGQRRAVNSQIIRRLAGVFLTQLSFDEYTQKSKKNSQIYSRRRSQMFRHSPFLGPFLRDALAEVKSVPMTKQLTCARKKSRAEVGPFEVRRFRKILDHPYNVIVVISEHPFKFVIK